MERRAFSVGKPSPVMMREARKALGLRTEEITVIGDTMETDILGGVQMGYRTILVLSGGSRREDVDGYAYRPDRIVDSIADVNPDAWAFGAEAVVMPTASGVWRDGEASL